MKISVRGRFRRTCESTCHEKTVMSACRGVHACWCGRTEDEVIEYCAQGKADDRVVLVIPVDNHQQ